MPRGEVHGAKHCISLPHDYARYPHDLLAKPFAPTPSSRHARLENTEWAATYIYLDHALTNLRKRTPRSRHASCSLRKMPQGSRPKRYVMEILGDSLNHARASNISSRVLHPTQILYNPPTNWPPLPCNYTPPPCPDPSPRR